MDTIIAIAAITLAILAQICAWRASSLAMAASDAWLAAALEAERAASSLVDSRGSRE